MNTTTRENQRWYDELAAELRVNGADGQTVGDAVATVEQHCAESDESPQEAFGDPRAYAATIPFTPHDTTRRVIVDGLLPAAVGVTGMQALPPAVVGVLEHHDVEVTKGAVAALTLLVAVGLCLTLFRTLTRNPLFGVPFIGTAAVGMTILGVLWRDPAFAVASWFALPVAVLLLLASFVGMLRLKPDPIVDPTRPAPRPLPAWLRVLLASVFIIAALVFTALRVWVR